MDVGAYPYSHGDPLLIDKIVNEFLAQGRFDRLRKECMSDADTKPAYQNLQQRVDNTVTQFLKKQVWRPDLNKNQLRDSLRKHILESGFFDAGINRIVDQVVNPNVLTTVFLPEVEEVVYNYLSIPKPFDKIYKKEWKTNVKCNGTLKDKFRIITCNLIMLGPEEDKIKSGNKNESKVSNENSNVEKNGKEKGYGNQEKNYPHEDQKPKDLVEKKPLKGNESSKEYIKTEPSESKELSGDKIKTEPEDKNTSTTPPPIPVQAINEKMEVPSEESQESLNRTEGLQIYESQWTPVPDSDDSVPLEINEKSMSDSRDSDDSIMNQMSPISQGRLTPDLELEVPEPKPEVKIKEEEMEKPPEKEEKKPLTFIGRIPKIKREDSESKKEEPPKEKLDVKNIYSSDESDSGKSFGKSDSDEKRKKTEKSQDDRKRDLPEKKRDHSRSSKDRKRDKSRERHRDKRDKSRDRDKKSSSSSSSSQRERSSSHHKSSHHHKDSKTKRKEDEKKKSKSTDDHGKERNKKEDRRSTDRDSNEREKDKSSAGRSQGESRKRDKEQSREEGKKKGDKREDSQVEKETEMVTGDTKVVVGTKVPEVVAKPVMESSIEVLDFSKLIRGGALTRFEFPKLADDFYVKFDSTGFKYFEDWEQSKLDCEEEFKEFVDEAENDLSLISEDETDFEFENDLVKENRKTIENLRKGLGNFSQSLIFDPVNSEFYKWTNNKFYQKFRKKGEVGKEEPEGTMKKNIDWDKNKENRERETMALHLKLLNRYKRKAMKLGKPRRRHRRPGFGIKEKNENRASALNRFGFGKIDNYLELPGLVGSELSVPESINSVNIFENKTVTLPDSPEENEEWGDNQKHKTTATDSKQSLPQAIPINLPPSPDSDDVNTNNDQKNATKKRIHKDREDEGTQKKQRRNYSQKYDSQDLYKPRLILNSSRARGRERGLEQDMISLGSGDSKSSTK